MPYIYTPHPCKWPQRTEYDANVVGTVWECETCEDEWEYQDGGLWRRTTHKHRRDAVVAHVQHKKKRGQHGKDQS